VSRSQTLLLRELLVDPLGVASLVPTSRYAVDRILTWFDWGGCRRFLELGPGTGAFTRRVLAHARVDTRVVAIEANPRFTTFLQGEIGDSRLTVARASAADAARVLADLGVERVDCVLSGVPFSTLPPRERAAILEVTRRLLAPGGRAVFYQVTGAVLPLLQSTFGRVEERRVWRNLPPLRVFGVG
jgi:phospholipid N-methyltransferase